MCLQKDKDLILKKEFGAFVCRHPVAAGKAMPTLEDTVYLIWWQGVKK
ncbi:MAG: hypothetical protein ABSB22_07515 [Thermodesulfobacteriota bacterium]